MQRVNVEREEAERENQLKQHLRKRPKRIIVFHHTQTSYTINEDTE